MKQTNLVTHTRLPSNNDCLDDDYLPMKDVQRIINCSLAQCYRMASCGTIPAIRLGGMVRVSRRALMQMLASAETRA
jgi:hypothetical protein